MNRSIMMTLSFVLGLTVVSMGSSAMANPQHQMSGAHESQRMQRGAMGYGRHKGGHHQHGKHHGHHDRHLFGPHWKNTLTAQQRAHIDQMHLTLSKAKMTIKARMKLLKVELALLATAEDPNREAIEKKIDDVLALKKNLMRIRYEHIVDMRKVLASEQRTSFDMDVLHKAKRGPGQGHKK